MASYESIFAALDGAAVRFVVVGGVAVVMHGHPRLTVDLDLVIDFATDAPNRAITALTGLGLEPRLPVDPQLFADATTRRGWVEERGLRVFTMIDPSTSLVEVDLFAEEPLPFDDLYRDAARIDVGGQLVRVASIDHLISMKRVAGRSQDLADIEALEGLRDD